MHKKDIKIEEDLNIALQNHRKNNFQIAEKIYRKILKAYPDDFQSIFHLGTLFLQTKKFKLNHRSNKCILVPPKFINATLCLSNECLLHYKLAYNGNYNDVKDQISVKWNDSRINFKWPNKNFILSSRDK